MTMNADGSDERVLIKDGALFDYEWSPDGFWLVYARQDGFFASELFIVPATGPTLADPPRNITRFATYNGGVTWSKTGNKLAFVSNRRKNLTSAFVLSLQKPASPGAPASKTFDWEDIHLRVKQPVNMAATECAISGDGSKIAFRGVSDGQSDLWIASSDGAKSRVTPRGTRGRRRYSGRRFSPASSISVTASATSEPPRSAPPREQPLPPFRTRPK